MDTLLASPFPQDDPFSRSRSPRLPAFDLSPSAGTPYDSFDPYPDSAHFPRTPSYNGSYQNSPYSTASDLPPSLDIHDSLGLLDADNPSGFSFSREYDPDDYDNPNPSATLLTFDDEYMPSLAHSAVAVAVTPPMYDNPSPNAFDHSSPASSNGPDDDRRSRASSTSSYIHPASPRLDLPHNFERLQFESPNWSAAPLPDRYSPPHKPLSPPQLLIPSSPAASRIDSPPIINAPDGDGVMHGGPQLHIVPATPVSGGGDTVQSVPFLGASQNGQQRDPSHWDPSQPQAQNQPLPSSSYADHSSFNAFPGSNHDPSASAMSYAPEPQSSVQHQHQGHQSSAATITSHHFLLPQQMAQRSRSLSDTSARPPIWDTLPAAMLAPPASHAHQGSNAGNDGNMGSLSHDSASALSLGGTVNMNDVLPGPSSHNPNANSNIHSPPNAPSIPRLSSSAGPTQTSFGRPPPPPQDPFPPPQLDLPYSLNQQGPSQSDYLSPDHPITAFSLRRAKSENNGNRMLGHRQVRSEDLRSTIHPFNSPGLLSPHPPHPQASSANMFPPPSSATLEFLARQSDAFPRQYLHPTEAVPSISARGGHHRRSSSGSRERPAGVGAWSSAASSARASPYPSPSASPRPGYGPLPDMAIPISNMGSARRAQLEMNAAGMMPPHMGPMGMSGIVGIGGMPGMPGVPGMNAPDADGVPMTVSKVNVTTPSTADASQKRRKQPANFACPVPGCGSTFTRHFNLKGHLRSHAEERPYQCKWPGCGKGFARQHDCKRHEQLHLNIRPFPCEGCKKNFARMDALNRHLRSEGGAECRKIQDELTASSGTESASDLPMSAEPSGAAPTPSSNGSLSASAASMKPDPDGWAIMGGVAM